MSKLSCHQSGLGKLRSCSCCTTVRELLMYDDMYLVSYKVLVYRDCCIQIYRDTVYWYTRISQTVLMHIALARFLLILLRITSLHCTAHCSNVTPPPPKQQSCLPPQAAVCHHQQSETLNGYSCPFFCFTPATSCFL